MSLVRRWAWTSLTLILGLVACGSEDTCSDDLKPWRKAELTAVEPPLDEEPDEVDTDDGPAVIEVQVVKILSHEPMTDFAVRLVPSSVNEREGERVVRTDAEGRFDLPFSGVSAVAPSDAGWHTDTTGAELYEHATLEVYRALRIHGRVVWEEGSPPGPIRTTRVWTQPSWRPEVAWVNPESGRFERHVRATPGYVLRVWSPFGYAPEIPIAPTDEAETKVGITLRPRPVVRGRIVGPNGEPVAEALVVARMNLPRWREDRFIPHPSWLDADPPYDQDAPRFRPPLPIVREWMGDAPPGQPVLTALQKTESDGAFLFRLPASGKLEIHVKTRNFEDHRRELGEVVHGAEGADDVEIRLTPVSSPSR